MNGSYLAGITAGMQLQTQRNEALSRSADRNRSATIRTARRSPRRPTTRSCSAPAWSCWRRPAPAARSWASTRPSRRRDVYRSTVRTKTYEFTKDATKILGWRDSADGNIAVLISNTSTARGRCHGDRQTHACGHPVDGVTPLVVGARVQLLGATSITPRPGRRWSWKARRMPAPLHCKCPGARAAIIPSGETFTINSSGTSQTFEFTTNAAAVQRPGPLAGLLRDGNVPIVIDITMSAQTVATQIMNALTANPVIGVTPVLVATNVQLLGAPRSCKIRILPSACLCPMARLPASSSNPARHLPSMAPRTRLRVHQGPTQFPLTGTLGDGNFPVLISDTSSASDIAAAIAAVLGGTPDFGLTVPRAAGWRSKAATGPPPAKVHRQRRRQHVRVHQDATTIDP